MKSSLITRIIFTCLITLFTCSANAEKLDAAGVIKAYTQWCAAIGKAQGNAGEVVKFYAPHAVLLPTLSDKILFNDNNGLNDYFTKLTSNKNMQCSTKRLVTEMDGEDFATTAGFYTFTYEDKDGKQVSVPARFTFAYKKYNKEWLIVQHHSSMMLNDL